MQRLAELEAQMLASPDQQISLTDPDARSMATSGRGSGVVGYNVQVAVETEHHLIVAHEVTNDGCDRAQLSAMGKEAKAVLEVEELEAVADRGYWDSEEILACDQAGITVTLPKPMTSSAKSKGRFGKQDFVYLPEEDAYRCPAGEKLRYYYSNVERGLTLRRYWTTACHELPDQEPLHHRSAAADHALGARGRAGGGAAPARSEPGGDAPAARGGRASVRHDQDAHGRHPLPDEDLAEGDRRDGAARARLQSHPGAEHPGHPAAHGRPQGIGAGLCSCHQARDTPDPRFRGDGSFIPSMIRPIRAHR